MHARSSAVRGRSEQLGAAIGYVHDKVLPAVRQMDGSLGLSMLADPDSGRCVVTTAWDDVEAMHRSADAVRPMREHTVDLLDGPVDVHEWEIALLHRVRETEDGACCRVIWTRGDPAATDPMVETFGRTVVPQLEDLPGFCSCSLLVDRRTGRSVTTVGYADRAAREEARPQGGALRQEFTRQMAQEVTEIAEFDLVLAHLRVPEIG